MERLTKRISLGNGNTTVDFSNARVGEFLTDHEKGVRALFEQLAEYEDLEEQGRLLKLPCAVGDTVYTIYYDDEDGLFIEEPKVEEVSTHRVWIDSMYFDYDDFGKTVFLTRQEAAAKLAEMQ